MGKMMMGLILVVAIEFALYLFTGTGDTTNSLLQLLINPSGVNFSNFGLNGSVGSNAFLTAIQAVFLAFILIAGLSVGTGFVFKQDSVIFAGLAAFLATFLISIIKFWVFLYSNLGAAFEAKSILASIFCAPLFIAWCIIVVDFARGRD